MIVKSSKLSDFKIKKLVWCFCVDVEASKVSLIVSLNRNTLNRFYKIFRTLIYYHQQKEFKTTGGDEQVYLKAGKVKFQIGRKEAEALVFEDPEQEQFQYYLLFRDQTTGKETYKNGRMLQIPKKGNKLITDFNYAYNPYSSYNDNWDCPITPKENILSVAIKAGEKKFK